MNFFRSILISSNQLVKCGSSVAYVYVYGRSSSACMGIYFKASIDVVLLIYLYLEKIRFVKSYKNSYT